MMNPPADPPDCDGGGAIPGITSRRARSFDILGGMNQPNECAQGPLASHLGDYRVYFMD